MVRNCTRYHTHSSCFSEMKSKHIYWSISIGSRRNSTLWITNQAFESVDQRPGSKIRMKIKYSWSPYNSNCEKELEIGREIHPCAIWPLLVLAVLFIYSKFRLDHSNGRIRNSKMQWGMLCVFMINHLFSWRTFVWNELTGITFETRKHKPSADRYSVNKSNMIIWDLIEVRYQWI